MVSWGITEYERLCTKALIEEQFFRDLIMHKMYTSRELSSYLSFFGIPPESVKNAILLLFSPATALQDGGWRG